MRVAFVCQPGQDHFLTPLVARLEADHGVVARIVAARSHADVTWAFEWGERVFVEWCADVAVDASRMQPAYGKPLYIRLHSYEAFGPWPGLVAWENVTACIFVAEHIRQIVRAEFPDFVEKCSALRTPIVPNGVDLERFQPQPWNGTHRIGVVANISGKKCPEMWLQILAMLPDRYSLHVAGRMDDKRYAYYLPHMAERLGVAERFHLDGPQTDVVEWWRDKDVCLSTSPHEGCPLNVLEAAALGKYVVCHDIAGADEWPCDARFADCGDGACDIDATKHWQERRVPLLIPTSLADNAAAIARVLA